MWVWTGCDWPQESVKSQAMLQIHEYGNKASVSIKGKESFD